MESLIALVITLLVLGFVGMPLLRERKPLEEVLADDADQDPELDRLLSQKETALAAIRELEFDHAVGNLSDEDYQQLKERYERKAISLLKTLDEVGEAEPNGRHEEESRRTVRATRARRGERSMVQGPVCPECGEPYEEGDAFCASCGAELGIYEEQSLICPECGEPYDEGDTFCASCGANLLGLEEQMDSDEEDVSRDKLERDAETVQPARPSKAYRRGRNRRTGRQRRASSNGKEAR